MLGVRQRQRRWVKDVGIKKPGNARDVSAEETKQLLAVPRQNPHDEQRVAEIPRHITTETARQRPRRRNCQEEIREEGLCGSGH